MLGRTLRDPSLLIRLSKGNWYFEVPLPPHLIPWKDPLELYGRFNAKDLIKIDALCIINEKFAIYGKVNLKDIKAGKFKLTDRDSVVIVEDKPRVTYEALGQILVYRCLLEAIWHAHVRKLIILRSSLYSELLPSEQAIVHTCERLSDEIGIPIKIFNLATDSFAM